MTATDRTGATEDEFRARVAAVTPPEVAEAAVVEQVARALYEADRDPDEFWTVRWELAYGLADHYRRLAAAAVAAYRTQDGGAEEGACVICGYPPAEHQGDGEMVHDYRAALAPQAGDDEGRIVPLSCDPVPSEAGK